MVKRSAHSDDALAQRLRAHGVNPTSQRLEIARALFRRPAHLSAEDVYAQVSRNKAHVSKATVYNTLGLFVQRGLVREVLVDPSKVFYDSNTAPHHHFYDADSHTLTDIDADQVAINQLPSLPEGTQLESVDVVVRLRRSS